MDLHRDEAVTAGELYIRAMIAKQDLGAEHAGARVGLVGVCCREEAGAPPPPSSHALASRLLLLPNPSPSPPPRRRPPPPQTCWAWC